MPRKLHSTDAPAEERPPRGEARRERMQVEQALLELAGQLARLDPSDFARLALPEDVGDAVADARACKAGKPRNRALRSVRSALRDLDPEEIVRAREHLARLEAVN